MAAVLPIAVSPWPAAVFAAFALAITLAISLDFLLAGRPTDLQIDRSGPASARLGESVETRLRVRNDGRRRVRGVLRDVLVALGRDPAAADGRTVPTRKLAGETSRDWARRYRAEVGPR